MAKKKYKTNISELEDHNKIVVDLGYSSNKKSCGIWWFGETVEWKGYSCSFSCSIEETAKKIYSSEKQVLLILEAPLSTCHDTAGNPAHRVSGEGEISFEKGRGWYYNAGALTTLSAMRFLSKLHERLGEMVDKVNLAEAIVTGTNTEKISSILKPVEVERVENCISNSHIQDAYTIYHGWDSPNSKLIMPYGKSTTAPDNALCCDAVLPNLMDGIATIKKFPKPKQ